MGLHSLLGSSSFRGVSRKEENLDTSVRQQGESQLTSVRGNMATALFKMPSLKLASQR
jgi:hypothetical protein